jgi:hypothetical protein
LISGFVARNECSAATDCPATRAVTHGRTGATEENTGTVREKNKSDISEGNECNGRNPVNVEIVATVKKTAIGIPTVLYSEDSNIALNEYRYA